MKLNKTEVNIAKIILMMLSADDNTESCEILIKNMFLDIGDDETKEDRKIEFFVLALYYGVFENEVIMKLSEILNLDLTYNQISILVEFIKKFNGQFHEPVSSNRLRALPNKIFNKVIELLINGDIHVDNHSAIRADLRLYESLHTLLDYETYKKLVFATICRTTSVYSNGRFGVQFDPLKDAYHMLYLKEEDYDRLCKEIFC